MSNLTVCTLGTASQAPNVKRALNSVVLRADKGEFRGFRIISILTLEGQTVLASLERHFQCQVALWRKAFNFA